jgi:hypothetical protein
MSAAKKLLPKKNQFQKSQPREYFQKVFAKE